MSRLHVFIDGTWLFHACGADRVLASKTEYSSTRFRLDFGKLSRALLAHAGRHDASCAVLGEQFLATSIFRLPDSLDSWPAEYDDISQEDVEKIRRNVAARQAFADLALNAGYASDAIYRPELKGYILRKLCMGRYQEKQVDTAVVALLVRSAVLRGEDFHAVITGDADILPAIAVAYPQYSRNVFIATTHPDELRAEHRQTAWSLHNFDFAIEPFYLQDHVADLHAGENVYVCAHCHKVFARRDPIPRRARPCCKPCDESRT